MSGGEGEAARPGTRAGDTDAGNGAEFHYREAPREWSCVAMAGGEQEEIERAGRGQSGGMTHADNTPRLVCGGSISGPGPGCLIDSLRRIANKRPEQHQPKTKIMKTKSSVVRSRAFRIFSVAAVAALFAPVTGSALIFNFTPTAATSAQAIAGFTAAANRWSTLLSDDMVVNMNIDFSLLGTGILGSTGSTMAFTNYTNYKNALLLDRTSSSDEIAVANLQAAADFDLLLNRTSNSPNGAGSATPFLDADADANNTTIRATTANFKALGLINPFSSARDASISFSTAFSFDFDPSDGITAGAFDFIGIATHEIGHALGFISGVDILDINSSTTFFRDDQFVFVAPLDLYRFSTESRAAGNVIDWTADTRAKYFSIDGGLTNLGGFSTGQTHGDGQQASHWKDSLGLGILDPTAARGELLAISALDARAFDVIGYNLAINAVPEPSVYGIGGVVALVGVVAWRRRGNRRPVGKATEAGR